MTDIAVASVDTEKVLVQYSRLVQLQRSF